LYLDWDMKQTFIFSYCREQRWWPCDALQYDPTHDDTEMDLGDKSTAFICVTPGTDTVQFMF